MIQRFFVLLLLLHGLPSLFAQTVPVAYVNIPQYLGTWYEIASIPQRFSKGCECTKAVYTAKRNPKKIGVFNTCNKNSPHGKLKKIRGFAKIKDETSNAKLKVTFFWPFSGDYWIIGLASDYRYSVVSNKSGSTLWILSRTPTMQNQDYQEALMIALSNGINIDKLKTTNQVGCNI